MIRAGGLAALLALAGCAAEEAVSPAPAPMQLRAGATVTVEGVRYEVRRANVRFAFGTPGVVPGPDGVLVTPPQVPTREDPQGEPAVVISGVGPLPEGWETARRAVALACGFDIEAEGVAMGWGFDLGTRPGGEGTDIFYPLTRCPGLDG